MRFKAVVAYDGTDYGGYQIQNNAPTIQADIERVLAKLTNTEIRVLASGRTDAGVHAEGQVIAFDADWGHSVADLHRGMNALLPSQIAVVELSEVDARFHPRFDALSRSYRYTIYCAPVRDPMVDRYSLHVARDLDVGAMAEATRCLIGRHDFEAFGSPPQGDNAVRHVLGAEWTCDQQWLTFDIEADAFLYRMVRMLVGTLLRVGYGALLPEEFKEILDTRDRQKAGPAITAKGLCLKSVTYASA
ncbi:MAG: tRNA pseudouridine(38-40) synthase TruA [Anaerolineae bacterium]|nr:tRNA pseudouridine(38-40) synthase TruA [Anaerolineae bacterium]